MKGVFCEFSQVHKSYHQGILYHCQGRWQGKTRKASQNTILVSVSLQFNRHNSSKCLTAVCCFGVFFMLVIPLYYIYKNLPATQNLWKEFQFGILFSLHSLS